MNGFMVFLAWGWLVSPGVEGEDSLRLQGGASEPDVHPTILWLVTQCIPSPEWTSLSGEGLRFGMRWQATPLLYSFGVNRKLSPWRWFVVEPFLRQSGSVELFCSPEYLNLQDRYDALWGVRTGIRGYIPLWQHGEYLSGSVGSSFFALGPNRGMSYEAGVYLFAGFVGAQATFSPFLSDSRWILTLRIRYF